MAVPSRRVNCIFIYSCSARRISFESDCFYGMGTWLNISICTPPPPIIASSYGPVNSFCYFMYIDYLGFEIQLKPELWKPIINLLRGEDASYRDSSYAYGIQKSLVFGNSIHLYRQIYIYINIYKYIYIYMARLVLSYETNLWWNKGHMK
jgi:hypothetical protein